jgi:lipopolysaccharide transport system permease protein
MPPESIRLTEQSIPNQVVIEARSRWFDIPLRAIWQYRELLYFLVWRDVKVRYKQTALGVLWILLQPLLSTMIFTVLFGILLEAPSGEVPYALFVLAGMIPWNYFSFSLTRSSGSVVASANLVTKVYFPRLIIPMAGVLASLVDFLIVSLALGGLMAVYGVLPTANLWLLPFFLLLAMSTAFGFGLWFSALNVRYRDVSWLMPFLIQVWMYLTPVVYSSTLLPERFRPYLGLNPMTGVVEGFRWALFGERMGSAAPGGFMFAISIIISLLVLLSGLVYFRHTERTFADVI